LPYTETDDTPTTFLRVNMENIIPLEKVLELARQLSPTDKLRLIESIAPQIERDLKSSTGEQHKSLRGLWRGLHITEQDIAEARRDRWAGFPREDK
jgi:hypothetical protein